MIDTIFTFITGIAVGIVLGIVATLAARPEPSPDDQHECVRGDV